MSITLIRSRRRLVQANSYNSPHHRKNKKLLATTQAERAQRNRDKKRAQLDRLKNRRDKLILFLIFIFNHILFF